MEGSCGPKSQFLMLENNFIRRYLGVIVFDFAAKNDTKVHPILVYGPTGESPDFCHSGGPTHIQVYFSELLTFSCVKSWDRSILMDVIIVKISVISRFRSSLDLDGLLTPSGIVTPRIVQERKACFLKINLVFQVSTVILSWIPAKFNKQFV